MDKYDFFIRLLDERISELSKSKCEEVEYYEDFVSKENAFNDGKTYGAIEELEYLKKQIEFLLK